MVVTRSGLVEKRICIAAFRENTDIKEAKRMISEQFVPWRIRI